MRIKQGIPHLSTLGIEFDCYPLTLIAGENGSGKTQLLQAISKSYFGKAFDMSFLSGTYYDYSLSLNMGTNKSLAQYRDVAEKYSGTLADFYWSKTLAELREAHLGEWRSAFEAHARNHLRQIDDEHVIREVAGSSDQDFDYFQTMMKQYADAAFAQANPHPPDGTSEYKRLQRRTVFCPDIKDIHLAEVVIGLSLDSSDVPHNSAQSVVDVADTFMRYFYKSTLIDEGRPSRYASDGSPITMTSEQFRNRFGDAPWEKFEQVLSICGLSHFELVKPKPHAVYTPYFIRSPEQWMVSSEALSSGEKIMLALALLAYQGPMFEEHNLLLLDEVDALLNPTLAAKYVDVLRLISEDRGARIVATTHSPTTAALWPNENMYLMRKDEPRLVERGRSSVVNFLSANLFRVVTRSFNVALVEDRDDADFYSVLSQIAAAAGFMNSSSLFWLSCRELQTGGSPSTPSGGKQVVKGWLEKLAPGVEANLICALCDRDNDGKIADAMHVTTRYAIENYQYDPIVGYLAYLMFEAPDRSWILSNSNLSLSDFSAASVSSDTRSKIQNLINEFSVKLSPFIEGKTGNSLPIASRDVELMNGAIFSYPIWLLDTSGHNLTASFCNSYKGVANRRDRLLKTMQTFPAWLPKDILDVVRDISSNN